MRSHLPLVLVPLALLVGAWLGAGPAARAQAGAARWEYKTVPWTLEDTTLVLREVTGDELSSVDDMAQALERGSEPVDDPRVQAIVQVHLERKLATLGEAGWEVFWVSDARSVVGGVLLPAPRLVAKRRAP